MRVRPRLALWWAALLVASARSDTAFVMVVQNFINEEPKDRILVGRIDRIDNPPRGAWHTTLVSATTQSLAEGGHGRQRYGNVRLFRETEAGQQEAVAPLDKTSFLQLLFDKQASGAASDGPAFTILSLDDNEYGDITINNCHYSLWDAVSDLVVFHNVDVAKLRFREQDETLEVVLSRTDDPQYQQNKSDAASKYKSCASVAEAFQLWVIDKADNAKLKKKVDGKPFDIFGSSEERRKALEHAALTPNPNANIKQYYSIIYSEQVEKIFAYFNVGAAPVFRNPVMTYLFVNGLLVARQNNSYAYPGKLSLEKPLGRVGCEIDSVKITHDKKDYYNKGAQRLLVFVKCRAGRVAV